MEGDEGGRRRKTGEKGKIEIGTRVEGRGRSQLVERPERKAKGER